MEHIEKYFFGLLVGVFCASMFFTAYLFLFPPQAEAPYCPEPERPPQAEL